jgi:hypothetical protein
MQDQHNTTQLPASPGCFTTGVVQGHQVLVARPARGLACICELGHWWRPPAGDLFPGAAAARLSIVEAPAEWAWPMRAEKWVWVYEAPNLVGHFPLPLACGSMTGNSKHAFACLLCLLIKALVCTTSKP